MDHSSAFRKTYLFNDAENHNGFISLYQMLRESKPDDCTHGKPVMCHFFEGDFRNSEKTPLLVQGDVQLFDVDCGDQIAWHAAYLARKEAEIERELADV